MIAEAIIGHAIGDYLLQNDWMARNKKNSYPPQLPTYSVDADPLDKISFQIAMDARNTRLAEYQQRDRTTLMRSWWIGNAACALHCLVWTLSVMLCAGTANPVLALWLFGTHYAVDRWNFISWWMRIAGQSSFRDNLKPWSSIMVDNTFHLLTILIGFRLLQG